jgi:hypothetical protein
MTCDVHCVPGRIRFKIDGLRDNGALAESLSQALAAENGVLRVEVRPASGSVIVHHDPLRIDAPALARTVDQHVLRAAAMRPLNGGGFGSGAAATVTSPPAAADAFVTGAVRQMAVVFGHAAFKVALEQAVRGGLNSLFRVTVGRI